MVVQVLLTGATGYIGGSVLSTLVNSDAYAITALVRTQEQADHLKSQLAVATLIGTLDNLDLLDEVSSKFDVVLDIACSQHTTAPKAFISGLQKRRQITGKDTHYIHNSGTSILADHANGAYASANIFHDNDADMYDIERKLEHQYGTYSLRVADILTVDAGLDFGVKTYIAVPAMIYGPGTGLFKTTSYQVPTLITAGINMRQPHHVGHGASIWTDVHIDDVVTFYTTLLKCIMRGAAISGKRGYYFLETGERSWKRRGDEIGAALVAKGIIPPENDRSVPFATDSAAAQHVGEGNQGVASLSFGSNSRVRAVLSRDIGWMPRHLPNELFADLPREIDVTLKNLG